MKLGLGLNLDYPITGSGLPGVVTAGLITRYKFSELSGTSVGDSVGSNNGTLSGSGYNWQSPNSPDQPGNTGYLRFNGTDGLLSYTVTGTASQSISFWIKPGSSPVSDNYGVIVVNSITGNGIYYRGGTRKIDCYYGADNNSAITLVEGTWYHIVVTITGTAVLLYINGSLDSTFSGSGTSYMFTGNDTSSESFSGFIANMCFYNIVLTPTQVLQNYQNP